MRYATLEEIDRESEYRRTHGQERRGRIAGQRGFIDLTTQQPPPGGTEQAQAPLPGQAPVQHDSSEVSRDADDVIPAAPVKRARVGDHNRTAGTHEPQIEYRMLNDVPDGWEHILGAEPGGSNCLLYTSPSPRD